MDSIVGYTGFVGGNIVAQHKFEGKYNSKNINEAFGTAPDLLVYSGVPAEMFLANSNPKADYEVIKNAAENIRKIAPKKLVLISSIAVIDNVQGTDEDYIINKSRLTAYGLNRYCLEEMAQDIISDCLVIRLPALFGKGLKKNFIYDIIHFFPAMLNKSKFDEFSAKENIIAECYFPQENGFYKLKLDESKNSELRSSFKRLGFSALNFTDSRSVFQFYNLSRLWDHIRIALENNIRLLNIATEPVTAAEIYQNIEGKEFHNELPKEPFNYDFRTKYDKLFGGKNGYILSKNIVLSDLLKFIKGDIQ